MDRDNGWVRKKKRLQRDVRKQETNREYHNTETKLYEILKLIYGRDNVIASVHPLWAFSYKGVLLEYDIGVTNEKLLVEYNGIQHYEYPNYFHKTRADFEAQYQRDQLKTELAKAHGWDLLIVKYNEEVSYRSIYKKLQQRRQRCLTMEKS